MSEEPRPSLKPTSQFASVAGTLSPLLCSVIGAILTSLAGIALLAMPFGEKWINASYDYLFSFGSPTITNRVVLVLMDNEARTELGQPREKLWDRALHAKLANRLASEGCPLVVFDVFFRHAETPAADAAFAQALRGLNKVVLMAEQADASHPGIASARPILPYEPFLAAAGTNWGVAWYDPDSDLVVRRHWPFPSPGPYPSLPWVAASLMGAHLDGAPEERWLRYYTISGPWVSLSYHLALLEPTNYFKDKIVFIGNKAESSLLNDERDKFRTPHTERTGQMVSGVQLHSTAFLNLLNEEWMKRPNWIVEVLFIVAFGSTLGATLWRRHLFAALLIALAAILVTVIGAVLLSHFTNYWFPWLIIAGGQIPVAIAWKLMTAPRRVAVSVDLPDVPAPVRAPGVFISYAHEDLATVMKLMQKLEQAGVEVWLDKGQLKGGDAYIGKIQDSIERCTVFIPIISHNTEAREQAFFRKEWFWATKQLEGTTGTDRKFIMPLVLDQSLLYQAKVPKEFKSLHWGIAPDGIPAQDWIEALNSELSRVKLSTKTTPTATKKGGGNQ